MSSKSSIFLTDNNEHCYEETNAPIYKDGKFVGYEIEIEISKEHAEITHDNQDIFITLKDPDSDIYKLIMMLKDKEGEIKPD